MNGNFVVMGQTPFCQTLNGLEHQFLNIEQTQTWSKTVKLQMDIEHFSFIEKSTF